MRAWSEQTVSEEFLSQRPDIIEGIVDPLLDSAGSPPRPLFTDPLVKLLTEPMVLDLPTSVLDDEDELKDNAIAIAAWIKDFEDQTFFSLRKKDDPNPCFVVGALKLPKSLLSDNAWWGYRSGEYKYQRVFEANATKMWEFYSKDMGPEVYGEEKNSELYPHDKSGVESPPHSPLQIPVPNLFKEISDWVNDGKWHHVVFQINYTHVTFVVDGVSKGPQPLLLETDVCSEILDASNVGTAMEEMTKFDAIRDSLGAKKARHLLPGRRLVDRLRGRSLMRKDFLAVPKTRKK